MCFDTDKKGHLQSQDIDGYYQTHSIVYADSEVANRVMSMVKQMMNKGQVIFSRHDL
jgi:hypothetical protein